MVDVASDSNSDEWCIVENKIYPDLILFNLSSTGDMVGHNNCVKKSGGSFSSEYFFAYCDEVRSNSYVLKTNFYSSICEEFHIEIEGWKCYHVKILSTEKCVKWKIDSKLWKK